jgi:hypothetical protein
MVDTPTYDRAVNWPADDLLGIAEYAEDLAGLLLEPGSPLTVGIYGAWGEGKTSFANLIEHYVMHREPKPEREPVWIEFSAWQHTSADSVWRALLLRIAEYAYGKPISGDGSAPGETKRFGQWLSEQLDGELTFWEPNKDPTPTERYTQLANRLGYGSISKNPDRQGQINSDLLPSLLNATLTTASGFSPLFGSLRGLFELGSSTTSADNQSTALAQAVRSASELGETLDQLVKQIEDKKAPLFIFVDDLDRGAPDGALDVLEAIRVFFGRAPNCTFIVAADEEILGKGLRMRYRDLLESAANQEARESYEQKGREYFEKIVQLGVRVPPRDDRQSHRFIAALYPDWVAATELALIAVGNNPRRLKQYCSQLTYKYRVYQRRQDRMREPSQTERAQKQRGRVINKLIALERLGAEYLKQLVALAQNDAALYRASVERVEQPGKLDDTPIDQPEAAASDSAVLQDLLLNGKPINELETAASDSPVLRRLLQTEPRLSAAAPSDVCLIAKFARLHPDAEAGGMLRCADATLDHIWQDLVAKGIHRTPEAHFALPERKLLDLLLEHPPFSDAGTYFFSAPDWRQQAQRLERIVVGLTQPLQARNTSAEDDNLAARIRQVADERFRLLLPGTMSTIIGDPEDAVLLDQFQHLQSLLLEPVPMSTLLDDHVARWRRLTAKHDSGIQDILSYYPQPLQSKVLDTLQQSGWREQLQIVEGSIADIDQEITRTGALLSEQTLQTVLAASQHAQLMNLVTCADTYRGITLAAFQCVKALFSDPIQLSQLLDEHQAPRLNVQTSTPDQRAKELADIQAQLSWRFDAARHFWNVRKFAKLDALDQRWPDLGRRFRQDVRFFRDVEAMLHQNSQLNDEWIARFKEDEDLRRLLLTRPFFSDITSEEAGTYAAATTPIASFPGSAQRHAAPESDGSQQATQATSRQSSPEQAGVGDALPGVTDSKTAAQQTQEEPSDTSPATISDTDAEVLVPKGEAQTPRDVIAELTGGRPFHEFELQIGTLPAGEGYAIRLRFDKAESEDIESRADIDSLLKVLDLALPHREPDSSAKIDRRLINKVGEALAREFLGEQLADQLSRALLSSDQVRLSLVIDPRLEPVPRLPWEALPAFLYRKSTAHFPLITRLVPNAPTSKLKQIGGSRVAIFASHGLRTDVLREAASRLSGEIIEALNRSGARSNDHATPINVLNLAGLAKEHVDIVHFIGYVHESNEDRNKLLFRGIQGRAQEVDAAELALSLTSAHVSLVVLNLFALSSPDGQPNYAGLATELVQSGVPIVVANHRSITADEAQTYSEAFYEALGAGRSLTEVLTDVRLTCERRGQNWAAFAVFTALPSLEMVRLLPPA